MATPVHGAGRSGSILFAWSANHPVCHMPNAAQAPMNALTVGAMGRSGAGVMWLRSR